MQQVSSWLTDITIFRSNYTFSSHAVKWIVVFTPSLLLNWPFSRALVQRNTKTTRFLSSPAFSPLFASNIHLICHRKFRTTFSRIQAPGKTNDRRNCRAFSATLFELISHNFSLPLASHSMSLNIDMRMILSLKSAGSHCNSPILFRIFFEDSRCLESWENLPLELHRLSINLIQFTEQVGLWIPLNLVFQDWLGSSPILPRHSTASEKT